MVYSGLDKFNVVYFAIAIQVAHFHYLLITIFLLVLVVLKYLKETDLAESILKLLETKRSILILINKQKGVTQVSQLVLLNFQTCEHGNDCFLEIRGC